MPDVYDKNLLLKFKQRMKVAEPELSYAKMRLETRPVFCVEIYCPVLKIWRHYISVQTQLSIIDVLKAITLPSRAPAC